MGISKRVYQRLRLIGYGTVPDFFCCSAKHRQQINRRTNPCPTPSHLPPLSKVRCCRPKKFGRLPEGLLAPLRFAPHSYRPLSKVRCCRPQKNLATTRGIVTLTFASHPTLKNPHYPFALHYILASPRKRGGGLTALQNRYSASSSFCNLSDCFQNYYTFCRQDGGDCFPLAQSLRCYPLTFKMVRFCCSVKPSQLWWGLLHIRTINEIYRTIPCFAPSPLPLNERFVGFASMPRQPFVPLHRATALCGCLYVSLHNGFVWLTLSVHA